MVDFSLILQISSHPHPIRCPRCTGADPEIQSSSITPSPITTMPFTTAEQVRTAIDNADMAIHGAIWDGTVVKVMAAMKGEIVSSFLSSFLIYLLKTIKPGRNFPSQAEWAVHCRIQSQAVPV